MRRAFLLHAKLLVAGVLVLVGGCGGGDADRVTDFVTGDYQITGYIGDQTFNLLGMEMPNGGFVLAVSRMHWEVVPANQATVVLNGTVVPMNRFPMSTPERAVFSLEDIAFGPGRDYQVRVTIGGQSAFAGFRTPASAHGVEITFAGMKLKPPRSPLQLPWVYAPGVDIDLSWRYPGGGNPPLVEIMVADRFTGVGVPQGSFFDYRVVLDGTRTEHRLTPFVTGSFYGDLAVWVSVPLNLSWEIVSGHLPLFALNAIYLVNPLAGVALEEICLDLDGDGYGNPASRLCTYPLLDCDDLNRNVNPGVVEICDNGIDDNCNGLVDAADPECQVEPPDEL